MISEELDLKKVRPSAYLRDGFFDHSGDWIKGLNESCSLATAHHLHDEGTDPEEVKKIADQFMELSIDVFGDAEIIEYQLIDEEFRDAIFQMMDSPEVRHSPVLTELFDTIRPHMKNWKNFAALVIHLQRISSQLSASQR
jgi:hypothetical protein